MIAELREKNIYLKFPYDLDLWYKVKTLPGRKYNHIEDSWTIPFSFEILNQLQKWKIGISAELQNYSETVKKNRESDITGLRGDLRPFQKIGVNYIQDHNGRALIGDEQGLGKTIQAIGYLHLNRERTVIICPSSLKLNWQREIEKWIPDADVQILYGTKPFKIESEIVIINYDIISCWIDAIKKFNPQILVLDEIQKIKNIKAHRTKVINKLAHVPKIIGLSGTPIENRPEEIYNAGKLIRPDLFGKFSEFKSRYCHNYGYEFNGTADTHLLNFFLTSTFMIRRLKKDILTELPEKTFSFIPMELKNWKEYRDAEQNFIAWVRREKGTEAAKRVENIEALAKIETLKQLATKGKMQDSLLWIKDFLETGNKLVVFCTHVFAVEELVKTFPDAVRVDGSVKDKQKQVDAFQNDPKVKLFVGNIISASEGITLTASSNVVILELPWSSSNVDQAADRVHRIGQRDAVTVYYLLARDTIEERIAKLLDKKRKMIASTMNGTEAEQSELLMELIKSYQS